MRAFEASDAVEEAQVFCYDNSLPFHALRGTARELVVRERRKGQVREASIASKSSWMCCVADGVMQAWSSRCVT